MTDNQGKLRSLVDKQGELPWRGRHELQELLNILLDGALDEDQQGLLEELLEHSKAARAEYIQFANLHVGLSYVAQSSSQNPYAEPKSGPQDQEVSQENLHSADALDKSLQASISALAVRASQWVYSSRRIAASIAIVVVAGLVLMFIQRSRPQVGLDRDRVHYAARIVDGAGCIWSNAVGSIAFDGLLRSSEALRLEEGLAKIRFESGAEIVIKAPASLFVESGLKCRLDQGEFTANVPKPARGFVVQTPLGQVVDLGTSFGVKVDSDVDLEVFEGEIEVYPGKIGQQLADVSFGPDFDRPVGLSSGATRRLQSEEGSAAVKLLNPIGPKHPFTRSLPKGDDPTGKKPTVLAVDSFGQGQFGARLLGRDGGFGWSSAWTDEGLDSNSLSFAVGPDGVTSRGSGDGAVQRRIANEIASLRTVYFSAEFCIDGPDKVCSAWLELFQYDTDRWSNGEHDLVAIGITDGQFSGRMAPWGTKAAEKLLGDCGAYQIGTRHLIVGKLEFNALDDKERLSIWVNPPLAEEPYPRRVIVKDTGWEFADAVAIRCWEMDDATSATIDEVRVGKTWMSVVQ